MYIVHVGTGSKLSMLLEEKYVYSPSHVESQVAKLSPMLVCLKSRHTDEPWDLENAEEREESGKSLCVSDGKKGRQRGVFTPV